MRPRPTILIVDYAPTRVGIRMSLADETTVCAEVGDPEHAVRAAKREQPDVCLIGRALAGEDLGTVRGISRAAPGCSVVVLTDGGDVDDLLECVRAGAAGYVPAGLDGQRLRRIVRAVAANEAVVPRAMVRDLLLELRGIGYGEGLTQREAQVLGMLRRGHPTAAIAARLGITPVTVRRHISRLVHKLGVETRAGLLATRDGGGD